MEISSKDLKDLKQAKKLLEVETIPVNICNWFGNAGEKIIGLFPDKWRKLLILSVIIAIEKSWEFTVGIMSEPDKPADPEIKHKVYAILSGAIGGLAIPTLFAEIPVTTVIMLRSVADIARDQGENFHDPETAIACLEVFAFGGKELGRDTGQTGYYATRAIIEKPIIESSKYMVQKGFAAMGVPFVAQLLAKIAVRYQSSISAKIAASAVPIAGAICGTAVNILLINFFQDKANGHFIVRRLERKYGYENVKQMYNMLKC